MPTPLNITSPTAGRIHLEPIGPANLEAVAQLLQERNNTMRSYTRWKYGRNHANIFRGVVALLDGAPVGCFGLVVRDLILPDCSRLHCGWFADWFVTTRVRTAGLGTQLLQEISKAYPLVFGHPAPDKARAICLANGYRPIGFQSRRRLVFQRFAYERTRTQYLFKAGGYWLAGFRRSAEARFSALSGETEHRPAAQFADVDEQSAWILDQPVRLDVFRKSGVWETVGLKVFFVDDVLPDTGVRRRILYTKGHRQFSPEAWRPFLQDCRHEGCLYLECFTTERALDRAWAGCGAWRYPDVPVLVHGEPDVTDKLFLHGWDRENWTYLAGGSENV